MPIEPDHQSWCATPENITRRLPGIGRGSERWSGQTDWLPQKCAVPVPSWLVVHSFCKRHSGLSVYSQRE